MDSISTQRTPSRTSTMKRNRLLSKASVVLFLSTAATTTNTVLGFTPQQQRRQIERFSVSPRNHRQQDDLTVMQSSLSANTDTWSRRRGDTPFGVRHRAQLVLEKAKNRTKRRLMSNDNTSFAFTEVNNKNNVRPVTSSSSSSTSLKAATAFVVAEPLVREEKVQQQKEQQQQPANDVENVPSATTQEKVEPFPFKLPQLTDRQRQMLLNGERIEEQSQMGRDGSGYVVFDIKSPPETVWECLLDFEKYPEFISTVRSVNVKKNRDTNDNQRRCGTANISRASFSLTKFHLQIAAVHKYQPHPNGDYMVFTLDRANKNMVLQDAKGIWYTESNPDGQGSDMTRVWLLCDLKVSEALPSVFVDYVAERAMPRATNWIKPQVDKKNKNKILQQARLRP